jgi:hypothetical protein
MSFSKADIAAIIKEQGVDNLTAKTVRVKLEAKLGMEAGALKAQKDAISTMIDEVLEEEEEADEGEGDEEEEEEPQPKAKKAKKEEKAADENPNKGKMTCTTRSGNEAPKNVKKVQARAVATRVRACIRRARAMRTRRAERRANARARLSWRS